MTHLQSGAGLSLFDRILHADYWLLLKVNRDWQHSLLDTFALLARETVSHAPFFLFLASFAILNYGWRGAQWVFTAMALVSVCDLLSSQVIKELFDRPRPCRDPLMSQQIRFLAKYCGMNGSFISSHASNHFAMAAYLYATLRFLSPLWWLSFVWAGLVAYAQVYVGVHYPSDVIAGALFGCLLGFSAARVFNNRIGLTTPAA